MKSRLRKYVAIKTIIAIALVMSTSIGAFAASHTHTYFLNRTVVIGTSPYDQNYHREGRDLYYKCKDCSDTYIVHDYVYINHSYTDVKTGNHYHSGVNNHYYEYEKSCKYCSYSYKYSVQGSCNSNCVIPEPQ